ncbi:MAG TPA: class II aldolase/adducin family protein [Dermatophilaceae bacterium]|nr:class II aldolase/adducin family protein [Dermatophilaceae bacterium]
MLMQKERELIIEYCLRMLKDELTVGTSGNVSIRVGEHIAITPSGVDYESLAPEDICVITLHGEHVDGPQGASTEVPMHTVVYQFTDALAVVHTHPVYATVVGTLLPEIPRIHYMLALLGGPVRVAPYAPFGTEKLARNCIVAMKDRYGVLLQNHGATTYGESLAQAYSRSLYLEWLCRIYCEAKALGDPRLLTEAELDAVAGAVATYGQQAPEG